MTGSDTTMLDLFRVEADTQCKVLQQRLLSLEEEPSNPEYLEELMRAAHSLKGAARLMQFEAIVKIAHTMEDIFVAAQKGKITVSADNIDILLRAADLIIEITDNNEEGMRVWDTDNEKTLVKIIDDLQAIANGKSNDKKVVKTTKQKEDNNTSNDSLVNLSIASMLDLFRTEISEQVSVLSGGLLELENDPMNSQLFEKLMRAAHSAKGAARMVGVDSVVKLAHVMEDVFVGAQNNKILITSGDIDVLLKVTDTIKVISVLSEEKINHWETQHEEEYTGLMAELESTITGKKKVITKKAKKSNKSDEEKSEEPIDARRALEASNNSLITEKKDVVKTAKAAQAKESQRVLRVSSEKWDRLMGLTGEVKVETGWLQQYISSMYRIKQHQVRIVEFLDYLRDALGKYKLDSHIMQMLMEVQHRAIMSRKELSDQITELDVYDRRITSLSARLHKEAIETRMRPFSDGIQGFQRMVREISRSLGKKVKLEVHGLATHVDRDVLEKIEAPLNHILRNAVDHGIELPEERVQLNKSEQATITISAAHKEGMLSITIEDDGRGIDLDRLKRKIIEKKLTSVEILENLSHEELLEFLFLPNFSTRDHVTDISGRGVGLDVVQEVIREISGNIKITTIPNQGTKFHFQLPLTLSVMSALIVEIANEPYAFPLARISRAIKVMAEDIEILEGQQYITLDEEHIGLVDAHQVLEIHGEQYYGAELPIIILSDGQRIFGVVVDKFIGQKELAIQTIDARLGKLKDISSASLLQDGTPILIVDIEDLLNAIDSIVKGGKLKNIGQIEQHVENKIKRILVVDDSLTVREVVRNLLESNGYKVAIAVDGIDGWNAVRANHYDLVISDIDMPRMNGFDFVRKIRSDRALGETPVIIVSYKDRDEDRKQGMEAGADYYLTKGSFQDDTLITAVSDLIGVA